MKNKKFRKQLIAKALKLSHRIIHFVDTFPKKQSARVVADQLLRSTTSIGTNIIEAQAASSKKDFVNFLNHALKSGNESKFWLLLTKDINNKLAAQSNKLFQEVDELVKILGSSIATIKGKRKL